MALPGTECIFSQQSEVPPKLSSRAISRAQGAQHRHEWQATKRALTSKFPASLQTPIKTNRSALPRRAASSAPCHGSLRPPRCAERCSGGCAAPCPHFAPRFLIPISRCFLRRSAFNSQPRKPLSRAICSQRIRPPGKVPRQGSAPRCPLQLAPPECRDRQPPRCLASLPRAASKLLPAGKASLASHSLKAAAGLVFLFGKWEVKWVSPLPHIP